MKGSLLPALIAIANSIHDTTARSPLVPFDYTKGNLESEGPGLPPISTSAHSTSSSVSSSISASAAPSDSSTAPASPSNSATSSLSANPSRLPSQSISASVIPVPGQSSKVPSSITPRPATLTATLNPAATEIALAKRAAIPACLKTVELSCLNLAANCIDTVNVDTINNVWSIASCVAATTCYGVGDLISSINCQTGFSATNAGEASLDYNNIYAPIVGSCAYAPGGCPITQQNFIDFYYGTLTAINTANYPSSSSVVIGFWNVVTAWAATGNSVPYLNFNDWLHYSSYPTSSPPPSGPTATTSYSYIYWNPNPAPSPGAPSQTFVAPGTTLVIPVPTTTTTITIAGATLTLDPGGTPIGGPVPTSISQPGAVTPTWNNNPIPPSGVPTVTFTAPPSWTSVVPVPTASNSPPQNITGPPGDHNSDGDDWWLLLFLGLIGGPPMPPDVGIPGGYTPIPTPPPVWTGSWSDPAPSSTSTSTSDEPGPSCPASIPDYDWADDPENADWDGQGTDPDLKKREEEKSVLEENVLEKRANPRSIGVPTCNLRTASPSFVSLTAGTYLSVGDDFPPNVNTALTVSQVPSRPHAGSATTAQEHVFELGYINQYFTSRAGSVGCNWVTSVWNAAVGGSTLAQQVLAVIDNQANMVWVDAPLNQAKSNVVNNNRDTPGEPPQSENVDSIGNVLSSNPLIYHAEYFARNIAALGQYFALTAGTFRATANAVQNLFASVTPATPVTPSLPADFNNWLRGILSDYPTGCTDRADNFFAYYLAHMGAVSLATQTQVPQCFVLYHQGFINPSSFNYQNLMPAAPTLPPCDTAGTPGRVSVGPDSGGNPVYITGNTKVIAVGRLDYPSIGFGNSVADPHFIVQAQGGGCGGAYFVEVGTAGNGFTDAGAALNCGGQTGAHTVGFSFVAGNTVLPNCVLYNQNDGSNVFKIICATSQNTATSCGNFLINSQVGTYPNAYLSQPSFSFAP